MVNDRRDRSINGESGRLDRSRTVRMSYSRFSNSLKAVAAATALATTLAIGAGHAIIDNFKESSVINRLAYEFQVDCISPETHRTQDNQHYFYVYDDIATYIEGMDDPEVGIYLFNINTNDYQTNKVLDYTRYDSLDEFLEAHQYKDSDEFREDMRNRLAKEENAKSLLQEANQDKVQHGFEQEGGIK